MAFHVHRSERTDTLLIGLGALLRDTADDPFTPELIAVPTPGIERFITQSLSRVLGTSAARNDGVCANVDFGSPTSLVNRAVAQACGVDLAADPWAAHRMVWPLLDAIDATLGQSWAEVLSRHLDGAGIDRRFAVASHIAGLFEAYGTQRPQMLTAWETRENGHDEVPPDLGWQPPLWRALRERIDEPSPAQRLRIACTELLENPAAVDLPARLSVFGPSRLPTFHLLVLEALSSHRDVHLWLPDPSPALWAALADQPPTPRREDSSADLAVHPLLRSLSRDARELRLRLTFDTDQYLPAQLDGHTLLGALQCQIRDNRAPAPSSADHSMQVHSCHGPTRQAEVIREVILGLLQAHPSLQPRDILIMCPDLETFAPLLSAAFSGPDAAGNLRLRIADRTSEQDNDVLAALAALLEMLTGRMELSAVLDFADRAPVRQRLGFDDDDIERLEQLTARAGIRWGLDAKHRREFGLPVNSGSWSWGMDRLLVGTALSEGGLPLLGGILPVDDVQSADVDRVGRLAELISRLRKVRAALTRQPMQQWAQTLATAISDLTSVSGNQTWQLPNALGALRTLADSAGGWDCELSLADVRWLLTDLLAGRPTRTNFRSGDLTVCGLAPMRSVPHRVICLVGMDDAAFPRAVAADGDDVLARAPMIGDRDVRSEDRQVLLDAVMAAREHLIITYTGADERTNAPRPPCVPLSELLDTVQGMTHGDIVVKHPLQPFDPRNFTEGALAENRAFSHDRQALAAARAAVGVRHPWHRMTLPGLPPLQRTDLTPLDLAAFMRSPIAAFLKSRLGITLRKADDPAPEQIPVHLNPLQKWQVGDRTTRLLAAGEAVDRVAAAARARGDLPPGALGAEVLAAVGREAADVAQRYETLREGTARQIHTVIALPDGHRISGVIADVFGDSILRYTFSKAKPRDRLRLWAELLCLAIAHPQTRWSARLVSKDGGIVLACPPPATAYESLTELVELYWAGMSSLLPLPVATSYAYAQGRMEGKNASMALRAARLSQWQNRYGAERDDPEIVALWGVDAEVDVLLDEVPQAHENWFDEATRFGMLARRLWEPILRAGQTP